MTHYKLSSKKYNDHWLSIEMTCKSIHNDILMLQQPAWRPGRYELGNFAKNIKGFKVLGENNQTLPFQKISKDCWQIDTKGQQTIKVCYEYFAAELNAGSTYVDENQIYVNPVNCFLYQPEATEDTFTIEVPKKLDWKLAAGLPLDKNGNMCANGIDVLMDSPFIYGAQMQHHVFKANEINFHLWFHGVCKPNWETLEQDFTKFINSQFDIFGSFPFKNDYHFLFHITTYPSYHGVEHVNNTVIQLGPSYGIDDKTSHHSLLGISSHELFHSWNVKTIRPADMYPYDYTKENYTNLGYVTEGFTTYYGDLMLWRSQVWDTQTYMNVLGDLITKHAHNFGKYNYSVAESSFDTWLDGYQLGAPNRKTSIYTEGAMVALLLDITTITYSKGIHGLNDWMRDLYEISKTRGYTEQDLIELAKKYAGEEGGELLQKVVYQAIDLMPLLTEKLNEIGIAINMHDIDATATVLGIKVFPNDESRILGLFKDGKSERAGLIAGDQLIHINDIVLDKNLNNWLSYFKGEKVKLTVKRKDKLMDVWLELDDEKHYQKVVLEVQSSSTFYKKWQHG